MHLRHLTIELRGARLMKDELCQHARWKSQCHICRPINLRASSSNDGLCVDKQANVENLRRIFVKMHRLLDLREEDSALIDLVNHADTLAQQLQDT